MTATSQSDGPAGVLRSVNHVAFVVGNVERSVEWYRANLGLETAIRQRQDNDYTRRLVGYPDAVLEVAHLRVPGPYAEAGPTLELIEYVTPPSAPRRHGTTNDLGATHLAFEVEDLPSLYAALQARGVVFHSSPVAIEAGANKGGYTCYLFDLDGNALELFQPARGSLTGTASG